MRATRPNRVRRQPLEEGPTVIARPRRRALSPTLLHRYNRDVLHRDHRDGVVLDHLRVRCVYATCRCGSYEPEPPQLPKTSFA